MSLRKFTPVSQKRVEETISFDLGELSLRRVTPGLANLGVSSSPPKTTPIEAQAQKPHEKMEQLGLKINPNRSRSGLVPQGIDAKSNAPKDLVEGGFYKLRRLSNGWSKGVVTTDADTPNGGHMVGVINKNTMYQHTDQVGEYLAALAARRAGLSRAEAGMAANTIRYSRPVQTGGSAPSTYIKATDRTFRELKAERLRMDKEDWSEFSEEQIEYRTFHNIWIFLSVDLSKIDSGTYLCLGRFRVRDYDGSALTLERTNIIPDIQLFANARNGVRLNVVNESENKEIVGNVVEIASGLLKSAKTEENRAKIEAAFGLLEFSKDYVDS